MGDQIYESDPLRRSQVFSHDEDRVHTLHDNKIPQRLFYTPWTLTVANKRIWAELRIAGRPIADFGLIDIMCLLLLWHVLSSVILSAAFYSALTAMMLVLFYTIRDMYSGHAFLPSLRRVLLDIGRTVDSTLR